MRTTHACVDYEISFVCETETSEESIIFTRRSWEYSNQLLLESLKQLSKFSCPQYWGILYPMVSQIILNIDIVQDIKVPNLSLVTRVPAEVASDVKRGVASWPHRSLHPIVAIELHWEPLSCKAPVCHLTIRKHFPALKHLDQSRQRLYGSDHMTGEKARPRGGPECSAHSLRLLRLWIVF